MIGYEIVEARICHLRDLLAHIRPGDLMELMASGKKPRHTLFRLWRDSMVRHAAVIEGETAAVWGCTSSPAQPVGEMWLFTAKCIEKLPIAYFRETRRIVAEMLEIWPILATAVACEYTQAVRFMQKVGFDIDQRTVYNGTDFYMLKMER